MGFIVRLSSVIHLFPKYHFTSAYSFFQYLISFYTSTSFLSELGFVTYTQRHFASPCITFVTNLYAFLLYHRWRRNQFSTLTYSYSNPSRYRSWPSTRHDRNSSLYTYVSSTDALGLTDLSERALDNDKRLETEGVVVVVLIFYHIRLTYIYFMN